MRAWFYVIGALLQFFGILLVAWPDILPYRERISRWLRRARLYSGTLDPLVLRVGGSVPKIVSVKPNASLEEQVAFLLERHQEAQRRLNTHDERLDTIEIGYRTGLVKTDQHVLDKISAAESEHRALRVVGATLLALGLVLTTVGNFLQE